MTLALKFFSPNEYIPDRGVRLSDRCARLPRMDDAHSTGVMSSDAAALAGRMLARQRWGTSKLDGMIRELHDRADELGDEQLNQLDQVRELAGQVGNSDNDEGGDAA